ncbi:hypothetical protein ACFFNY_11685 [Paenibacillus hodogayensis]|uniref:DUF4367 domain-containing protein n=1 Tax=Paenibacillus hodogayensis TaxID=279208 RepID=A0ABV5VVF3_9BACL
MMKRIEAEFEAEELKRELSVSPLRQRGFSDDLRKRIETRVDEKIPCTRSWLKVVGSFCSAAVIVAAITVFLVNGEEAKNIALTEHNTTALQPDQAALFDAYGSQNSFTSGLLIGLRNDDRDTSYRTLYIAPRNDRPAVVAQGSGILVPYKRDFWRIEPLHYETVTDRHDFFIAHPATQRAVEARTIGPTLFKDDPSEKVIHTEKILFAANEYVSLETNETSTRVPSSTVSKTWTTTIPALASKRKPVTLGEVLSAAAKKEDFALDQWFVTRDQGRWVAMTSTDRSSTSGGEYRQLDVQLPKTVINHDEICCTWSEIGSRFPGASDMFSSPENDMTIVNADGMLLVFGSPNQLGGEPALSIKLKTKETVVMAQWATDHYVDEWAQKTAELLR